ncbi:MAG: hypothetical protein CYPHOPRED_000944 [Cyphobasidiales sp. Tagirdzhanova-0007]|nr:MAG: hypothetical protein CYPHOPRED_000944 [Cyphobasidiales sp. Tagirdzhanova-0007]
MADLSPKMQSTPMLRSSSSTVNIFRTDSSPKLSSSPKLTSSPMLRSCSTTDVLRADSLPSSPKLRSSPTMDVLRTCFGRGSKTAGDADRSIEVQEPSSPSLPKSPKTSTPLKQPQTPRTVSAKAVSFDVPTLEKKKARKSAWSEKDTSPKSSPNAARQGAKERIDLPPDLLDNIKRFSLDQYAQQHFAQKKYSIFRRHAAYSMKWQTDDLTAPILTLPKLLHGDAQQCFTHLRYIMGDRLRPETTSQKPFDPASSPSAWDHSTTEEARNLLGLGLARPELQDEIFVQLICQVSENPSAISLYRGWQSMQVLLVNFPRSPSLEPALRRFLVEKKASAPKTRLGIIARYTLMKVDAIIVKGREPQGQSADSVRNSSRLGGRVPAQCIWRNTVERHVAPERGVPLCQNPHNRQSMQH